MSGQYNNNNRRGGGGGTKDFKADPIKGYLTSRGVNIAYAKDMAIAGLINKEDIPEWTDRFTILQYGKLKVEAVVENELMRITNRLREKLAAKTDLKPENTQEGDPAASDKEPTDSDAEFDVDRERRLYEQEMAEEQAKAEEQELMKDNAKHQEDAEVPKGYYFNDNTKMYHCKGCPKSYKTENGAAKHVAEKHTTDGSYGGHK